ncbi:MAG: RNA polymerase sigma factor [Actinomycetota bacterium]
MKPDLDPAAAFPSWLRAARAGDAAGFAGFYDWLGPEVKRFAVARGARDADAVTNDAFVAAFRRLGDFDGDHRAFRAWIYAIARHRLIDAHRAEQRRPPVADHPSGLGDERAASAEDQALAGIGDPRIQALLGSLTDAQQEVIVLRVINGLSLQETADAVKRPVSAVKRLQARGLGQLRRTISDEGVSS